MVTLLQHRRVKGVLYQAIGFIPASIAVSNDEKGKALKRRLDDLISQLDQEKIYHGYLKYSKLPESGEMPLE